MVFFKKLSNFNSDQQVWISKMYFEGPNLCLKDFPSIKVNLKRFFRTDRVSDKRDFFKYSYHPKKSVVLIFSFKDHKTNKSRFFLDFFPNVFGTVKGDVFF